MTIPSRYDTSDKPPRPVTTCEICLIEKDDSEFYLKHPTECKDCLDDNSAEIQDEFSGLRRLNHPAMMRY
jgi:hypothetical protein